MRKTKLLLAIVGLLLGLATPGWAQTWSDVTSDYIKNADFEGNHEASTTETVADGRAIYVPADWTVSRENGNTNDLTVLSSSDTGANNITITDFSSDDRGSKTFWTRLRWGGQWWSSGVQGKPTSLGITQTLTELPSGIYRLSADAVAISRETSPSATSTIYATIGENTTSKSVTIVGTSDKNDGSTFSSTPTWSTYTTDDIIITSASEATIGATIVQNWQHEVQAGFDNFKLEKLTEVPSGGYDLTSLVGTGKDDWHGTETVDKDNVTLSGYYNKDHFTGQSMWQTVDVPNGVYTAELYCHAHCAAWECTAITEAQDQTDYTILSANDVKVGIPIKNDKALSEGLTTYTLENIIVSNGQLKFSIDNDKQGANWITVQIKSLKYLGESLKAVYEQALAAAKTALADEANSNVTGTEKTNLNSAISTYGSATDDTYAEAISALNSAKDAFTSAAVNYDALIREIEKAKALGITETTADSYKPTSDMTAEKALSNTQGLKVLEYNLVKNDYKYDVELGETWTTTGSTGEKSEQHWSGEARSYKEQSESNWAATSWEISYNQDVTLPAGEYVFKVAGRQSSGACTLSLDVTSNGTTLGTVSDFPEGDTGYGIDTDGATNFSSDGNYANDGNGRGWEWRYVKFTLDDDATINVAVNAKASEVHQWVSFCDYTLQTNDESKISLIAYNIALSEAKAAIENDDYTNVTGDEKTDLQAQIDADDDLDKTSKDAIDAATEALKEKTTNFTDAKTNYDNWVAAKAIEQDTLAYAAEAKYTAITTAQAAEPKNAEAAQEAADAVTKVIRQYYESHALAEGVDGTQIDVPDYRMEVTYNSEDHTFGSWAVFGQTNGTIQLLDAQSFTDGDGKSDYKYADIYKSDNNAGIKQSISLEPGKYMLTVTARANKTSGAAFWVFAGTNKTDIDRIGNTGGVFGGGWNDASVEFTVGTTSDVEIGVQSGNGKDLWWSATRFRLVKIADLEEITLDETSTTDGTLIEENKNEVVNVTLSRSIITGIHNAFCLPFALTTTDLTAMFGEDATVKTFTGETVDDDYNITINFEQTTEGIAAGTPFIVLTNNTELGKTTFEGVTIAATEAGYTTTGTYFNFYGTFAKYASGSSPLTTDDYIMGKAGKWGHPSKAGNAFKGYRAYLKQETALPDNARVNVNIDGETTAIENVFGETNSSDAIYNLRGQKVSNTQKGVYIQNGRKVVIK